MSEIDKMKKIDKNQKCEIRKSVNENDKLKKYASKFSGIRKYTNLQRSVNDNSTQTENTDDVKLGKYGSLQSKLVAITDSLLSTLDEEDQGLNVIYNPMHTEPQSCTHAPLPSAQVAQAASSAQVAQAAPSAQVAQAAPSAQVAQAALSAQVAQAAPSAQVAQKCSARATQPCHPAPVTQSRSYAQATHSQSRLQRPHPLSSRRTQGSPLNSFAQASPSRGQQPQPIPVVQIGAAARHVRVSSPAAPSPGGPETIVIRTSLVNGLGSRLHARSVNATCYMYRGADIPTIQSRIPYILTPGVRPRYIVLQTAGNDATKQLSPVILARYETLIGDIRRRCLETTILLSKVPPRRGTARTMATIREINTQLDIFAERMSNVFAVDICPNSVEHFRKYRTHFNVYGVTHFADKLACSLRNFSTPLHASPM